MKRLIKIILVVSICFSCISKQTKQLKADTTINFYNIVLFVNFSDTDHSQHYDSYWGDCFMENPNIQELWTGTNNKSLRSYVNKISYGDIQVESLFPQLNNDGKIVPYELDNNASYYSEYKDVLVSDAIEKLIDSKKLSTSQLLDGNGDGCVDNVTVVVPCESHNSNELFYGLCASFSGNIKLNNKSVAKYNIVTESGAYLSSGQSGLPIHEFLHTLGYPDLYRASDSFAINPVGVWDIMSSQSTYVQYPLAYQRKTIHKNFTIPIVSTNQKSYSLYSVSDAIENPEHKDNQALIIKTASSDSEFFVVEYRQKAPQYVNGKLNEGAYERMIYGSGLIIYRVNTSYNTNHTYTDPYYIYVFRPNETDDTFSFGDGKGSLNNSYLSLESGITSYGSSLPTATISDGAITYSDGTNSGIVISNVSSASGNSITFDIEINDSVSNNYWKSLTTSSDTGYQLDSTNIGNDLYFALYDFNQGKLLKYSNSSWSNILTLPKGYDYRITSFNNELYIAYVNSNFDKVRLAKYTNNSFTTLYEASAETNYADMSLTSNENEIVFAFVKSIDGYGSSITTVKYNASGLNTSIPVLNVSANNPSISLEGDTIALAYRDFMNNNKLHTYLYRNNTWDEISNSFACDSPNISLRNNHLVVNTKGEDGLLFYDYSINDKQWTKIGDDLPGVGSTEVSYLYPNNDLYIVYAHGGTNDKAAVYYLKDSSWCMIGNALETTSDALNIKGILVDNVLYAVYLKNEHIVVKNHVTEKPTHLEKNKDISYTVKHYCDEELVYEKTYNDKTFDTIVNPQIEIQKDSLNVISYEGYRLKSISPLVAEGDFVDDKTIVTFYYEKIKEDKLGVTIDAISVVLSDQIGMRVFMNVVDNNKINETKFCYQIENQTKQTISLLSLDKGDDDKYYYTIPFDSNKTNIKVDLWIEEGEKTSTKQSTSIDEYCDIAYAQTSDEKTQKLLKAIKEYGDSSLKYFDAASNNKLLTANSTIENYHYSFSYFNNAASYIRLKQASLLLQSAVSLKIYFDFFDSNTMNQYDVTVQGVDTSRIEKGQNYLLIKDIKASELCDYFDIEVSKDKNKLISIHYSPFSYAKQVLLLNDDSYINLKNLMIRMVNYGLASKEYVDKEK